MLKAPSIRSEEAVHLLRALYRQASCLFDDYARQYMKAHIIHRFRQNKSVVSEQRQSRLLKEGRQALSTLQRANDGHQWRMHKVMEMAYGRVGRRKHQLLDPLLKAESGEPFVPNNPRTSPPGTSLLLEALIKSSRGRYFKKAEPQIPDKNNWDRPFPAIRKANILWRYRSYVVQHIRPPLPSHEYDRLERLATGEETPISAQRNPSCPTQVKPDRYPETRTITKRFQRRMYQKILKDVPKPIWHAKSANWSMQFQTPITSITSASDSSDFDHLDENGKLIKVKKNTIPLDWTSLVS